MVVELGSGRLRVEEDMGEEVAKVLGGCGLKGGGGNGRTVESRGLVGEL